MVADPGGDIPGMDGWMDASVIECIHQSIRQSISPEECGWAMNSRP